MKRFYLSYIFSIVLPFRIFLEKEHIKSDAPPSLEGLPASIVSKITNY